MDLTAVKRHPMFEMEYYPNRGSWKLLDSDPTRPLVSNSFLPLQSEWLPPLRSCRENPELADADSKTIL